MVFPEQPNLLKVLKNNIVIRRKLFSFKLVLAFCAFLSTLFLTQLLAYQQLDVLLSKQKAARNAEAVAVKDRLKTAIKTSIAATSSLGFIVENYGVPPNFDFISKILISHSPCIDAIELLDSGVITHIYPLAGNEIVIGYDVLKDPTRNKEALRAIQKHELYFAGPLQLKQGGTGIIGRLPLYRNDQFFGFVAVIIELNSFVKASGISTYKSEIYRYQMAKIDVNTGEEEQFFPGEHIRNDDVSSMVYIDEGDWKLYVQNREELNWLDVKWISLLGCLLAIVAGLFTFRLAHEPTKLRLLVEEKMLDLNRERQKFKNSFSHSFFGKALINFKDKTISDFNPRFIEILGLKENEIQQFWEMPWTSQYDLGALNTCEFQLTHPDGTEHWISLTISPLEDEQREYSHICTLFDITEEKNLHLDVQRASQQRNQILESIGDAFFSLDKDLNITYWNKQAEKLLIHRREDVLGKSLISIFGEFIKEDDLIRNAPQIQQGQPIHFKQHIPRIEKWFDVSVYPFVSGTAVYFSDITETVKHVAAIEKRNEKLSEIAWIQSHVVRAPLARMMGIISLLEMEEIDDEETRKLRKQLLIAAHELDSILYTIVEKANMIEKEVKEVVG